MASNSLALVVSRSVKDTLRSRFRGLSGFNNRVAYFAYRSVITTTRLLGCSHFLLGQPYSAEEHPHLVSKFNLLHPAGAINFAPPGLSYVEDPFLRSCQGIVEGKLRRAAIFTCEIPDAKFSAENGLVYDAQWRNVVESVLDYERFYTFRKTFRPRRVTRRPGVFSSIQHPWHFNNWHWTADSLAQVRSLDVHMQGHPLTLLISSDLGRVHRDSLEAILPENFKVEYVNPNEWLEVETFVLPSFVSARANAFFPQEYYHYIRFHTFRRLGIDRPTRPSGRFYISRARAKHRRIINEEETFTLLSKYGFEKVFMEDLTFAQQVALFRRAEAVVSPHGAALGGIIYGEEMKVCVLYPESRPAGYFYTLAVGAGHQHFCTNADVSEDDDFMVDPTALQRVVSEEMRLTPAPELVLEQSRAMLV